MMIIKAFRIKASMRSSKLFLIVIIYVNQLRCRKCNSALYGILFVMIDYYHV